MHDWGYYPGDEEARNYVLPEVKKMKLFVYGTLRRGYRLHNWLADQKYLECAKTKEGYALLDLGWFPGLVKERGHAGIHGEVYEIDESFLPTLDRVESSMFKRGAVQLEGHREKVQAYFYIGEREGVPLFEGTIWGSTL